MAVKDLQSTSCDTCMLDALASALLCSLLFLTLFCSCDYAFMWSTSPAFSFTSYQRRNVTSIRCRHLPPLTATTTITTTSTTADAAPTTVATVTASCYCFILTLRRVLSDETLQTTFQSRQFSQIGINITNNSTD